jgi:hypothetical protein
MSSASTLSSVSDARLIAADVATATLTPLLTQFNSGVDGVLQRQISLRERLLSLTAGV